MRAGELLRTARVERGLGQAALARRAGTTQTYVSRIERGDVSPSLETLQRLLHAMGLQLRLDVEPLSWGNASPDKLREEFETSTPEQRVEEAMALSRFLTEVAVSADRAPGDDARS